MKHLKTYEFFTPKEEWKVGDWLVAKNGQLKDRLLTIYTERGELVYHKKYQIARIIDTSNYGQTSERFPIMVKDENGDMVRNTKIGEVGTQFLKDNFVTLEEWEVMRNTKKYNL